MSIFSRPADERIPARAASAIASMNLKSDVYLRVKSALEDIGAKFQSPGVVDELVAHFVFPKLRYALFMLGTRRDRGYQTRKSAEWQRLGWKIEFLSGLYICQSSDEAIRAELKRTLEERRRSCK